MLLYMDIRVQGLPTKVTNVTPPPKNDDSIVLFAATSFCHLPDMHWFAMTTLCNIFIQLYGKFWSLARNIQDNGARESKLVYRILQAYFG